MQSKSIVFPIETTAILCGEFDDCQEFEIFHIKSLFDDCQEFDEIFFFQGWYGENKKNPKLWQFAILNVNHENTIISITQNLLRIKFLNIL